MEKEEKLKKTLSDQETNRLAFVVYRKALVYTGGVIAFAVAVLGFLGYDDWKDLRNNIDALEKKASKADSIITTNIKILTRLEDDREKFYIAYLEQSVELKQLAKTLKNNVDTTVSESRREIMSAIDSTNAKFSREQKKLSRDKKSLDAQLAEMDTLRRDIENYLESLRTAGSTGLLLQANKSNSFKQEFNFTIKLGNVGNDYVYDVEILFGHSEEKVGVKRIEMGKEYSFPCEACGKETQLMDMEFFFTPIARLAQPIVHDLLVARLRWQAVTQQ